MSPHLGIDISHWQGNAGLPLAHWDKLAKAGVRFAVLKATQHTSYVDPAFDENVQRARKRGILVGAYHFLEDDLGTAQAEHFISTVKRIGGLADVALVCDVERVPTTTPADDSRATTIRAFLRRVGQLASRNVLLVYTAEGYWRAIGNPDVTSLADGLWQARWDGRRHTLQHPHLPDAPPRAGFGGWGRARMWQFGALRYSVGGKAFAIDGNAFYGSEATLHDLFDTNAQLPKPRPEPEPTPSGFRDEYNGRISVIESAIRVLSPVVSRGGTEATEDALAALAALRIEREGG